MEFKNEKEREDMLAVMKEISHHLHLGEVARDQIKEIIEAAAETFDLEKSLIRKVSRFYHKKSISEFENETSDIKNLYNQITATQING
tara:strand:+ start:467 stop:730 length:264 start_codon:yes stop_codon:yes gene_type:complete